MEDLKRRVHEGGYRVDADAVARCIVQQLTTERMWTRHAPLGSLEISVSPRRVGEMIVSPQPEDLPAGS